MRPQWCVDLSFERSFFSRTSKNTFVLSVANVMCPMTASSCRNLAFTPRIAGADPRSNLSEKSVRTTVSLWQ